MTPEYLAKQLRKLEKLVRRLECLLCPVQACPVTINWSYSGQDLNDAPFFIINVNGQQAVSGGACIFPNCPQPGGGSITVSGGDEIEFLIGNDGSFHIYTYSVTGSVDGLMDSGGNPGGQSSFSFIASCQTYTIIGNQD